MMESSEVKVGQLVKWIDHEHHNSFDLGVVVQGVHFGGIPPHRQGVRVLWMDGESGFHSLHQLTLVSDVAQ